MLPFREVSDGGLEFRMVERKSFSYQPRRYHAAAFQDQLRFRAKKEGADFQHPTLGRQPDRGISRTEGATPFDTVYVHAG